MRRIKGAAVLVVALAVLTGCNAPGPSAGTPSADPDSIAVAAITWEGGAQDPKLTMKTPLRVAQPTLGVIEPGSGDTIATGQLVAFDSLVVDGETGAVEASTFGTDSPEQLILSPNTANVTMLTALQSSRVGGRFLYVVPDLQSASGQEEATDSLPSKVIAISIRSVTTLPTEAAGEAKTPDPSLPVVRFGNGDAVALEPPRGEPAGELVVGELIEGTGPAVGEGQTVAVKYQMWLWDGTPIGAAWGEDPAVAFNLRDAISGWSKAIVGRKVGSRVLMVLPPALAYGGAGQDAIPPDSTLIIMTDVIAAY